MNCNGFDILLQDMALDEYARRYCFENKQFCSKFRALLSGALDFQMRSCICIKKYVRSSVHLSVSPSVHPSHTS